jgi:ABC-type transport system substrate-binding protein
LPDRIRGASVDAWSMNLLERKMSTTGSAARKRLFDEVQLIPGEQQPYIFLTTRHLIVGAKSEPGNLILWNCDDMFRR